ncbi:MAG: hypothetical protein AAF493_23185 [Pseudomonadota bacterium]
MACNRILRILSAAAVTLLTGPLVHADTPSLNTAEKSAMALVHQAMAMVATGADRFGCPASDSYMLSAEVAFDGTGSLDVDDHIIASTAEDSPRGTFVHIVTQEAGEIGMTHFDNVDAGVNFSLEAEIGYGDSVFEVETETHGHVWLSDWFNGDVFGSISGIRARGLAVTTKDDDPRGKWRHTASYARPNGSLGIISATAVRIAPNGAASCRVRLRFCVVDDYGGSTIQIGNCFLEIEH